MREVTHWLSAWDSTGCRQIQLPPGTILTGCRIQRQVDGGKEAGVYAVEFESGGRRLACPLFLFQPRTQILDETAFNRHLSAIG